MLTIGMLFGLTGGLQYIIPGFLKEHLSFEKVRPLHVSSVVFWIIIAAMGSVLTYMLSKACKSAILYFHHNHYWHPHFFYYGYVWRT